MGVGREARREEEGRDKRRKGGRKDGRKGGNLHNQECSKQVYDMKMGIVDLCSTTFEILSLALLNFRI